MRHQSVDEAFVSEALVSVQRGVQVAVERITHGLSHNLQAVPAAASERPLPLGGRALDSNNAGVLFWCCFAGLAAFDLCYIAPRSDGKSLSVRRSIQHVLFWFCVGLAFNGVIFASFGTEIGIAWFNGYILEYLLSIDNLFVFHVVFTSYSTPQSQVPKALRLGILGAVVLRIFTYTLGSEVFRLPPVVQMFFGLLLVYSGYKTVALDGDDEDPRNNSLVQFITRYLPLTEDYDSSGHLLVQVPDRAPDSGDCLPEVSDGESRSSGASGPQAGNPRRLRMVWRGTMLLLVVIVLQVMDVVFAVDSVTAKIAEYDNTFINFSSSAFAMLCLRSMYFVLTLCLVYLRFLKYGVAAILAFIGFKLMASPWYSIRETYSFGAICGVFLASILVSVVFPEGDAASAGATAACELPKGGAAGEDEAGAAAGQAEEELSPEGDAASAGATAACELPEGGAAGEDEAGATAGKTEGELSPEEPVDEEEDATAPNKPGVSFNVDDAGHAQ